MKKVLIAVMVLVATYSLSAQDKVVYSVQSTSTNSAYSVPSPIRVNFETEYPGVTAVVWEPAGETWHVTYKGDNRINHVYYSTQLWYIEHPMSYRFALPVNNTYVPDEVAVAAVNLYGNNLYSFTKMKSVNDAEVYMVTTLENSTTKSTWLDAQGVVVSGDVYKMKADDDEIKVKADKL